MQRQLETSGARPAIDRSGGGWGARALLLAAVLLLAAIGLAVNASASQSATASRSATGGNPSSFAFQPISIQRIKLPTGVAEARWPAFTTDGKHLLFWSKGDLWITALGGGDVHCLTCGLAGDPSPGTDLANMVTPFPDGKRVFIELDSQVATAGMDVLECHPSVVHCRSRQLVPVDYSGAEAAVIPPGGAASTPQIGLNVAAHAQLSPDGRYVGFSEARSDAIEAMIVGRLQRDGAKYAVIHPRVINPAGPTSSTDPNVKAWSDSSALFELKTFTDGGRDVTYVEGGGTSLNHTTVWSVNLATGHRTLLASAPDWDEDNGVSPNGKLLSLYSQRTMHYVDWIGGLLPVRSFIDAPLSTMGSNLGGYTECMGPMWLLPSSGDDQGELMGEPLVDYRYPGVHVVDTLAESSQWSPNGTMIALDTTDNPTGLAAPFLLVAHLTATKPSRPLKPVSSQPGSWAPAPTGYHGAIGFDGTVTLHGPGGGTVTVHYGGTPGAISGQWSETYAHYSANGRDFVNGTVTASASGPGDGSYSSHLTMSGANKGSDAADLSFGTNGVSGHATSTYDGNTISGPGSFETGPMAQGGPSTACPGEMVSEPALHVTATNKGHGTYKLKVTVSIAGAGPNETQIDTQPVEHATIHVGRAVTYADGAGIAIVKVTRRRTVTVTAGDTLRPTSVRLGLSSPHRHR
jgi:hypothetical protein